MPPRVPTVLGTDGSPRLLRSLFRSGVLHFPPSIVLGVHATLTPSLLTLFGVDVARKPFRIGSTAFGPAFSRLSTSPGLKLLSSFSASWWTAILTLLPEPPVLGCFLSADLMVDCSEEIVLLFPGVSNTGLFCVIILLRDSNRGVSVRVSDSIMISLDDEWS